MAVLLAVVVLGDSPSRADAALPSEYELKAVFLLNFARFSTWPPSAFPSGDDPFVIGVLGADPFGSCLETAFRDEMVAGRRLEIRRFSRRDEYRNCHLLFISRSEALHLPQVISAVSGRHVLTVSDIDRFVYKNGMIGMLMEQSRVKVEVNYDQIQHEGLELSAKLLKMSFVLRKELHSLVRTFTTAFCRYEPRGLSHA